MLDTECACVYALGMQIVQHIRKSILELNQAEFAVIALTTQATVSRWESGELSPDLNQLAAIRAEVLRQEKEWNDTWFFEAPVQESAA